MRFAKSALLHLAAGSGPLSAADAERLVDEAFMLTQFHSGASLAVKRQHAADVRQLIRRCDPTDGSVAELIQWLATHDPDGAEPETAPAVPPPSAPEPEAGREPRVALADATPADVAAAREALDVAQRTVAERDAAHGHNIEARDAAKTKAAETNDDDDWTRYHAADRAVIQSELLCKRAASELARLQEDLAEVDTAEKTTRFAAALEACDDDALAELLAEAVPLGVQIRALRESSTQIVYRATLEQQRRAAVAMAIGRELGLSETDITRRMVRRSLGFDGAPSRSVQAVSILLDQLVSARCAEAPAQEAAE